MPCGYKHSHFEGCQFGAGERTTIWRGRRFCKWHLPEAAKAHWSERQKRGFASALERLVGALAARSAAADFRGVTFPVRAKFAHGSLVAANFQGTLFCETADFTAVFFEGKTCFDSATFRKDVSFESAELKGDVSFSSVKFCNGANFYDTTFGGETYFHSAFIDSTLDCESARFVGPVSFSSATFTGDADFEDAVFESTANFGSAAFGDHAEFAGAEFCGEVNFRSASFTDADFDSAIFHKEVSFFSTAFDGIGSWGRGCVIKFESAQFSGPVHFGAAESKNLPRMEFTGAKFVSTASFEDRVFTKGVSFAGASFAVAPRFDKCVASEVPTFPNEKAFSDRSSEGAPKAYRVLRSICLTAGARAEARQFLALEHESLRNIPGGMPPTVWILSWIYARVSDYGRNPVVPLLTIAALVLTSALFYVGLSVPPLSPHAGVDWWRVGYGLMFSIQQVVDPIGVGPDVKAALFGQAHEIPLWLHVMSIAESIVAKIVMALWADAFRWRVTVMLAAKT